MCKMGFVASLMLIPLEPIHPLVVQTMLVPPVMEQAGAHANVGTKLKPQSIHLTGTESWVRIRMELEAIMERRRDGRNILELSGCSLNNADMIAMSRVLCAWPARAGIILLA